MKIDADTLVANAVAFAQTYTALKGALIKQGVNPAEAQNEARNAALIAALAKDGDGDTCPLCGRPK